jgi:hypothetical protein
MSLSWYVEMPFWVQSHRYSRKCAEASVQEECLIRWFAS